MTPYAETIKRISALLDTRVAQDCIRFKTEGPAASLVREVAHELALLENYMQEQGDEQEAEMMFKMGGTD